jgi:hypothetical protein
MANKRKSSTAKIFALAISFESKSYGGRNMLPKHSIASSGVIQREATRGQFGALVEFFFSTMIAA